MAGKIKKMISTIIEQRSGGNPGIIQTTKAKFILRGININQTSTILVFKDTK